eukprot:TRINITY_DN3345_c0_g1_i2.p1 TRINITY_DN3345_c0_g1~~TRINITY_DN3345_c0_g1_i2.p1  ORF type:complete len:805 (+),score=209.38 TRINITY_DN3345_c0_g1_i2:118-2532(+)
MGLTAEQPSLPAPVQQQQQLEHAGACPRRDDFVEMASPVELAVIWVEKARKGSCTWVDSCTDSQLAWYRLRKRLQPGFATILIVLLLLSLFEEASWCLGPNLNCKVTEDGHPVPNFGLPVAPFLVTNSIEVLCLLVIAFRAFLRFKSLGAAHFLGGWHYFLFALLGIAFLDCFVAFFNLNGIVKGTFRICRLCRPLIFLCCKKKLRQSTARVCRAVPMFIDVLASLAICVVIFVWLGILIFARSDEGEAQMDNWSETFAALWILYTTANDPDVFLPAYRQSRWAFFFFGGYLVISLYLLNGVLLAAVYDSFKKLLKDSLKAFMVRRDDALEKAFDLLKDESGIITEDKWAVFFTLYCDPAFGLTAQGCCQRGQDQGYNVKRSRLAFQALDEDRTGGLDLNNWRLVISCLNRDNVYIMKSKPPTQPRLRCLKALHKAVNQGFDVFGRTIDWQKCTDFIIFLDVIFCFAQTCVYVADADGGHYNERIWSKQEAWYWVALVTSMFYGFEVFLRLWALGRERFWNENTFQNRFDLFIVGGLFALEVVYLIWQPNAAAVRVLGILRVVRGFRLFYRIKPFRQLATVLIRLAPTYARLGMLLFVVFYCYATMGIQLFGGQIYKGNPALDGSDFDTTSGGYYTLNFNDFLSGMVTLFVLMIVNNWFIIAHGFLLASGTKWSQVFFISFYVVVNLVVLNIVLALILDCFGTVRDELEDAGKAAPPQGQEGNPMSPQLSHAYTREEVLMRVFQNDLEETNDYDSMNDSDLCIWSLAELSICTKQAARQARLSTSGQGRGQQSFSVEKWEKCRA